MAGRYLLLDRVGVGGMAEVFRAKMLDGVSDNLVAVKRIRPHLAADEAFVTMFVDEAQIAGSLRHENIVRIHELGKLQGTHFISMEYVFGRDLLQLLATLRRQDQVMAPQMAAWIAAEVLRGLHHAHTRHDEHGRPLSLIHRDVSPQNVLISYDGAVKLIDFGIAKASSRVYQTFGDVVKGKLGYMSPEQLLGEAIDHRSDIFAVGTCLHEMLTCRRLFKGPNDAEVVERLKEARVDPPSRINPNVSPALDSIVMKALAQRPENRWQTAERMQQALLAYLQATEPPFGSAQLGFVMRSIFRSQMEAEWHHLNQLARVQTEGVSVAQTFEGESTDPGGFEAEDTDVSQQPAQAGEVSRFVSVEKVMSKSAPAMEAEPSDPFMLVSKPPVEKQAAPPQELLPGSTQDFTIEPGTFEAYDTSEDFSRPFQGNQLIQSGMKVHVPNDSIPDLPVALPPVKPPVTRSAEFGRQRPRREMPWLLLGLTAFVAILLGAAGVLIALFAAGVLPPT